MPMPQLNLDDYGPLQSKRILHQAVEDESFDEITTTDLTVTNAPTAPTGRGADYVIVRDNVSADLLAQADVICDGSNDQTEIQAIFNALSGSETIAFFGEFYLDRSSDQTYELSLTDLSNITLHGNATFKLVDEPLYPSVNMLTLFGCNHIKIEGLTFDFNTQTNKPANFHWGKAIAVYGSTGGALPNSSSNIEITKCHFANGPLYRTGVGVGAPQIGVQIRGNVDTVNFHHNTGYNLGVFFDCEWGYMNPDGTYTDAASQPDQIIADSNICDTMTWNAIYTSDSNNVKITNNVLTNFAGTVAMKFGSGDYAIGCANGTITGNTITGYCEEKAGATTTGLIILVNRVQQYDISHNHLTYTTNQVAAYIRAYADTYVPSYGTISNNNLNGTSSFYGANGLHLTARYTTIDSNEIYGIGSSGIAITGTSTNTPSNNIVSNNRIHNCNVHGLLINNTSFNTIIIGNSISNSSKAANNTYYDIYLSYVNNTTISNNTCRKASSGNQCKYNIYSDSDCSGNLIINNNIELSGVSGSIVISDTTSTIIGNKGYIAPSEIRTASGSMVPTGTMTVTTVSGTFTESPLTLKPGVNTMHCTATGTINVVMPAGSTAVCTSGDATVTAPAGGLCPASATTLVSVTTGAGADDFTITVHCNAFSWHNPEAQDIFVKKIVINRTAAGGTATAECNVGIADNGTVDDPGIEFFDSILLNNAAAIHDSYVAGGTSYGTQTIWVSCQDSASATGGWVVAKIDTEIANALAGTYYIEYCGQ